MGWMKTIGMLVSGVCIGVLLFCTFTGFGVSSNPIAGNWYMADDQGYCNLEFYDNGLGTIYSHYNKDLMAATDYGMDGYLKTLVIDVRYTREGNMKYSADGVSLYAESYTGQNIYVPESIFPGLDIGTFEIKQEGKYKRNLIWSGDDGEEPDILKRGKYTP